MKYPNLNPLLEYIGNLENTVRAFVPQGQWHFFLNMSEGAKEELDRLTWETPSKWEQDGTGKLLRGKKVNKNGSRTRSRSRMSKV